MSILGLVNNKLYRVENGFRIYTQGEVGIEEIFYSEINIHFYDHLNFGAKIYYLQCNSKHKFSLNQNELEYLYTLDKRYEEDLFYVFSDNIKNIKYFQKLDLFFITNLKYLYFICLIPKLDKNNKYYFDLIIAVKPEFDINQFYS